MSQTGYHSAKHWMRLCLAWALGSVLALQTGWLPAAAQSTGYVLEFDSADDYVQVARVDTVMDGSTWAGTKTISLWVKPTGSTAPSTAPEGGLLILGNDRPRTFGVTRANFGGDRLWVWNNDGNGIDRIPITFTVGEWVHIALVHAGGTLTAYTTYEDGVTVEHSIASGSTDRQGSTGDGILFIGGSGRSTTFFTGQIDEVRLWDATLSPAEIQEWMARELTPSGPAPASLRAYYQMSNGAGSSLADDKGTVTGSSENLKPGTIFGGTSWLATNAFPLSTNQPPMADPQALSTDEDTAVAITLTGSDGDNGPSPLTYSLITQPANGTLDGTAPNLTYTPHANYFGTDSFTFVANDGGANSEAALVTITVNPVNDGAPVAVDDGATIVNLAPVTIDVLGNDVDPDGNGLTITVESAPTAGVASVSGSAIVYEPFESFPGSDSFVYRVIDGDGETATATVTVAAIVPPDAIDDYPTLSEDTQGYIIQVLANDDGHGHTLVIASHTNPSHGTLVNLGGGEFTYTPNADYYGADSFTYTVADSQGGTATATVHLTITEENDAPVAVPDTADVVNGAPATIEVLNNDSDVDGGPLIITGVTGALYGTVITNSESTVLTYTPGAMFSTGDSFDYTVSDGRGGTATATVTVVARTAGTAGYALQFDGISDYVMLATTVDMFNLPNADWRNTKSVSLWIKPAQAGQMPSRQDPAYCDAIFGDRPRWWGISQCILGGQDRIWVWNYDGNYDLVGVPYTPGEWINITLVHSDNLWRVYKNGNLADQKASGTTQQPIALPILQLGGVIVSSTKIWTFNGQLDEVSLWTVARTQEQIQGSLFASLDGNEDGLAAYYRMSDGSGTALTDDSIYSWNGTIKETLFSGVTREGRVEMPIPQWVSSGAFDGADGELSAAAVGVADTVVLTLERSPEHDPTWDGFNIFLPQVR